MFDKPLMPAEAFAAVDAQLSGKHPGAAVWPSAYWLTHEQDDAHHIHAENGQDGVEWTTFCENLQGALQTLKPLYSFWRAYESNENDLYLITYIKARRHLYGKMGMIFTQIHNESGMDWNRYLIVGFQQEIFGSAFENDHQNFPRASRAYEIITPTADERRRLGI